MKILHIASEYPPQKVFGLGRFVRDLAVEQARQGHEVHVVTNSMGGKDHVIVDRGVNVHRVNFPPPPKPVGASTMITQFNIQCIELVFADKICLDADVVNAHDWLTGLAAKIISQKIKAQFILFIHDIVVGKNLGKLDNESKYAGNAEYWFCREADKIICVSNHTREELIKTYGANPDKTFAIHNAVSKENFSAPDEKDLYFFRKVLAEENEKIILYVGRLDKEKGIDILLDAFADFKKTLENLKLVIVGKGILEENLRKKAGELKVENAVQFTGYLSETVLNYVYHCSDVQVVPSLYEPFGIVALEGMICSLPVIASNTGGLKEIIEDGKSGMYVKPGDSHSLAEALSKILTDPKQAKQIANEGYKRAEEIFSWKRVAERIEEIICKPETKVVDESHLPPNAYLKSSESPKDRILLIVQTHKADFPLLDLNEKQFQYLANQGHKIVFLFCKGEAAFLGKKWWEIASGIEVDAPPGHENLVRKTFLGYSSAMKIKDWNWLIKMDSDTLISGNIQSFIDRYRNIDAVGAPSVFEPVLSAIKMAGPPDIPPDSLEKLGNKYLRGFFYLIKRKALEKALPFLQKISERMRSEDASVTACLAATNAKITFCPDISCYLSKDNSSFHPDSPAINVESRDSEELQFFADKALESFLIKNKLPVITDEDKIELSIVTQTRDRKDLLLRFLQTLDDNWPKNNKAELIIVDYGGNDTLSAELKKINIGKLRYIYADEPGRFSSSHARNIGYKAANGDYILSLDCDLILPDGFIQNIFAEIKKHPNSAIFGPVYKLMPKEQDALESGQLDPIKDFNILKEKALPHKINAPSGAIILAPRSSILAVGGYDEEYIGYGFQDIDLVERLKRSGLHQALPGSVFALHQFHGYPENYNTAEIEQNNRDRFLSQGQNFIRNKGRHWGSLPQGDIDLQKVSWLEGISRKKIPIMTKEEKKNEVIIWCKDASENEMKLILGYYLDSPKDKLWRWISSDKSDLIKCRNILPENLGNHLFEVHSTAQLTTQIARTALFLIPASSAFSEDLYLTAERLAAEVVVVEGRKKSSCNSVETLKKKVSENGLLPQIRKILVCMDEGIGNMIMLTPALRALNNLYPASEIHVIGSSAALQILKGMPGVTRLIGEKNIPDDIYDLMIVTGWRRSFNQRLKGIKSKTEPLVAPKMDFEIHEGEQHLALINSLGYKGVFPPTYCAFEPFKLEKHKGLKIGLADTANPLPGWQKKRWPHYRELARQLIKKGHTVYTFGDKADADFYKDQPWPKGVISYQGKLELLETAGAIKDLDILIANDSGLAHMAAALGTPLMCLWGPTNMQKNRPLGSKITNISLGLPCSPCQMTEIWDTCTDWRCINEISVDSVFEKIREFNSKPFPYQVK